MTSVADYIVSNIKENLASNVFHIDIFNSCHLAFSIVCYCCNVSWASWPSHIVECHSVGLTVSKCHFTGLTGS